MDHLLGDLCRQYDDVSVAGYLLIFQGLATAQRVKVGHVSGPLLVEGCVTFARESWGVMGAPVLRQMGVANSRDIGKIVWRLADAGIISRQPTDNLADFDVSPELDAVVGYDATYPWDVSSFHPSLSRPSKSI